MSLTIDQILAADNSAPVEVHISQWGGSVFVRQLSALEALRLSGALQDAKGDTIKARQEQLVVALSAYLCDEHGKSIATIDQAREIAGKSAAAVNAIVQAGHKLNSVDTDAADTAAKN